ncbi:MAG: NfeD family protein [Burkholderiales bacterium]
MCHLLLLLPVLALPVLWIWPPAIALPVYGVAAAVSLGVYALAYWAWKAPLAHGPQTLLGAAGHVVSVGERHVTLRVRGELWLANVEGAALALGEEATVTGVEGLRLTARKRAPISSVGEL